MPGCSFYSCKNYSKINKNVVYHRFPSDDNICALWIEKCKRPEITNTKNARICSDHFDEECYEDDMQHRILGLPVRKVLKKNAVPRQMFRETSISELCTVALSEISSDDSLNVKATASLTKQESVNGDNDSVNCNIKVKESPFSDPINTRKYNCAFNPPIESLSEDTTEKNNGNVQININERQKKRATVCVDCIRFKATISMLRKENRFLMKELEELQNFTIRNRRPKRVLCKFTKSTKNR